MAVKTKVLLTCILCIIVINIANGLTECKEVMKPADIPCMIITSWEYPNDCSTYNMTIYNSTPEATDWRNLTNYTGTDRCNTTFNYSEEGSYIFNTSGGGDSGRIVVENEMETAIAIILTTFGALALIGGIYLVLRSKY